MTIEIYPDHSVIFDFQYWGRIDRLSATEPPRFSRWLGSGGLWCGVVMGGEWGDPVPISAPSHTPGGEINPEFEAAIRAAVSKGARA